jgi:hypothetical protein
VLIQLKINITILYYCIIPISELSVQFSFCSSEVDLLKENLKQKNQNQKNFRECCRDGTLCLSCGIIAFSSAFTIHLSMHKYYIYKMCSQ